METYVFDGSLVGLLSAIFTRYERRAAGVGVIAQAAHQQALLGTHLSIRSDEGQATRVWRGLLDRVGADGCSRLYAACLSEDAGAYQSLFNVVHDVFDRGGEVLSDFGNTDVLAVSQWARKVHREKHRMEAFVRFQRLADGLYFSSVEPDFNVLPLIRKHFTDRYADQRWLIHDGKRRYGLYYDGVSTSEVTLGFDGHTQPGSGKSIPVELLAEDEPLYQQLWKRYFQRANIPARKNMKLHIRHIPKRYWRHLTEKW